MIYSRLYTLAHQGLVWPRNQWTVTTNWTGRNRPSLLHGSLLTCLDVIYSDWWHTEDHVHITHIRSVEWCGGADNNPFFPYRTGGAVEFPA